MTAPDVRRGERAAGLVSTSAGLLVFLMFLLFAVQLLFSLYAASTITAVANDAAHRAAAADAPHRRAIEAEARRSLGRVGESARFEWLESDSDLDGVADTIVLTVAAQPPRFVPASVGDGIGLGLIERTVRVRLESAP